MAGNSMAESEPWFTFFWNIRNFSYCCQKTNECIESPKMQLQKINPSWKLALFPRRELTEDIYLSIYGDCLDESESVNVKMELALLAEDDSVLKINPINKRTFEKESNWVRELLLRREEMLSFLSRDTLRIRCRLWRTDQRLLIQHFS
ncbi:hypothetical protein TNIN_53441 [Trichonephila inaurata madagascariensis]|uniref:MATH domain-containing protein n=1 Tax=Trichonephila inaurata madagascariensis TaxID=2747483 RepID=A0A8X7BRC9_9ARAC|nr:hypothetical protein TNIN_53441 [Trichonephila inaurata madagascariensis]